MKYSVRIVKYNQAVRTIKKLVAGVGFEPTTFGLWARNYNSIIIAKREENLARFPNITKAPIVKW